MKGPSLLSSGARAWVGVAARAHVARGLAGGFAQLCHGRRAPLERMCPGDCLAYYSPTTEFRGGEPLRAFTALGRVVGEHAYQVDLGGGFVPFRRDVAFVPNLRDAPIAALLAELHFVERNRNWGMLARRGVFEIDAHDLGVIANAMGLWQSLGSSRGVKPRERQVASLFAWTTSPTR